MWLAVMVSPSGLVAPTGKVYDETQRIHRHMRRGGNSYVFASESADLIVYDGNEKLPGFKIMFVNIEDEVIAKTKKYTESKK